LRSLLGKVAGKAAGCVAAGLLLGMAVSSSGSETPVPSRPTPQVDPGAIQNEANRKQQRLEDEIRQEHKRRQESGKNIAEPAATSKPGQPAVNTSKPDRELTK